MCRRPPQRWRLVATVISIGFAFVLVGFAASFLGTDQPGRSHGNTEDGARSLGQHDAQPVLGQPGVVKER